MVNGLATTQNPVPASDFCKDTLRAWVKHFLIIVFDNEFGFGMFRIQYNRMDVIKVKGRHSSSRPPTLMRLRLGSYSGDREKSLLLFGFISFKGIAFLRKTFGLGLLQKMPF